MGKNESAKKNHPNTRKPAYNVFCLTIPEKSCNLHQKPAMSGCEPLLSMLELLTTQDRYHVLINCVLFLGQKCKTLYVKRWLVVAETSSYPSDVARRYGGSLFELAQDAGCVDAVEQNINAFMADIDANPDLQHLIRSPVFSAREQLSAIDALVKKTGRDSVNAAGADAAGLVGNFLKTVAANRRLFMLQSMVEAFGLLAAEMRGEIVADVTSAHRLEPAQEQELQAVLSEVTGKNVRLRLDVDGSLLGGLVVRIGSRQLDTSLRSKLSSLKIALKEVG